MNVVDLGTEIRWLQLVVERTRASFGDISQWRFLFEYMVNVIMHYLTRAQCGRNSHTYGIAVAGHGEKRL